MDGSPLRRILRLAVPALPVLAAEPLYLLVDTAVVGHLGGTELGALGVGAIVLAQLSTQLTFLSYGTTARAARLHGAGHRDQAVTEGVQATWLAIAAGFLLMGLGQLFAAPVARVLAGDGALADAATTWLRVALCGVPMILITLAGNGWLRGVQDTRRPLYYVLTGNGVSAVLCPLLVHTAGFGLQGSAYANIIGQTVGAALFLGALRKVPLRPRPDVMRAQLVLGRDLVLRSLAFQACFVSATTVAARTSVGAVGAHQVVLQLWTFLALVLDSLAIAAQSLVGAALGRGDDREARELGTKLTRYGLVFGIALGVVFACLVAVIPRAFTGDAAVLAEIPHAWWFFVALQPVAGVVFALDGVLLGAGDARFLRTATLASALLGFLPLIWLSLAMGWGLAGVWTGLTLFMLIRLATVLARMRSGRWAVVGAPQ
ncbi:MATE family efflux transporter [Actinokineospora auranticolor]|uniref:Putative MATE family efflux protein n=1 Tax=Actinokineospora auranticolor TaxID=155976 RepID=A0A2S6GQH4_9PSEU|nr:MATE family efflux transporter [Actinokineospora auranticolor]PPK67437.1 putative MATE family efflux protein [Actinokineospora auranticolor]